jgi:hypothetical protein
LVHPLFVPLLAGYRSVLGLFGYSGLMLVPLERLNLAAAALALAGLFWLAEHLEAGSLAAAASVLLLGFCPGFWEGTLRPDPYALAAACSMLALIFLIGDIPADDRQRHVLAGAAAGLAMDFHAAAMSLIAVAALEAWMRAGWTRRGARLLAGFLGGLAFSLAAGYAIYAAYYRAIPGYYHLESFPVFFSKLEQMPLTSIYTSRDPSKQVWDFLHTMGHQGSVGLLALAAAALGLGVISRRLRLEASSAQSRAIPLAVVSILTYSLFFLINNTQNGFIYGALLATPILICAAAAQSWLARAAFTAAACWVLGVNVLTGIPNGPQGDPLFRETMFLDSLLRPGDVLLMPGAPFPEVLYPRHLNLLMTGGSADAQATVVPSCGPEELRLRLADILKQGRRVYFVPGDLASLQPGEWPDISTQKRRQAFWVRDPGSPETVRRIDSMRKDLAARFDMDCRIASPQGWQYCRLRLKPGGRGGRAAAAGPALSRLELDGISRLLAARSLDPHSRTRAHYLMDWLVENPQDAYALSDLASLLLRHEDYSSMEASGRLLSEPAMRRLIEALKNLSSAGDKAKALVDQGVSSFQSGRKGEAERVFRQAVELDPASIPAWMSLGAVLAVSGRSSQAVPCYDKILALDPPERDVRADALAARANALAALGQGARARRDRQEALRIASPSWPSRKEIDPGVDH